MFKTYGQSIAGAISEGGLVRVCVRNQLMQPEEVWEFIDTLKDELWQARKNNGREPIANVGADRPDECDPPF